jgi:alpha-tubulin suppressor-like RCC1 family protein
MNDEVKTEKITSEDVGKVFAFYLKHKNKIWAILLLVLGGAGFNVDRIAEALPDIGVAAVKKDLEAFKEEVNAKFEQLKVCECSIDENSTPKVARPIK